MSSTGALLKALRANPDLREWVVQRYIERPLLVDRRKFHLRVYVLCVGRLQVYVCKDILALFSLQEYASATLSERNAHITNTCVQNPESPEEERRSVQMWDEVIEAIRQEKGADAGVAAESVFGEVCKTVGDVFNAVSPEQTTFMSLPNCFELFGFDFLLDEAFHPWFLEANAEPDFKQVRRVCTPRRQLPHADRSPWTKHSPMLTAPHGLSTRRWTAMRRPETDCKALCAP